jgi:hypothetical protein
MSARLVRVEGFEPITERGLNPLPLPLGLTRKVVSTAGLEPALKRLRRSPSVPTGVDEVAASARFERASVGLEGPTPYPTARLC